MKMRLLFNTAYAKEGFTLLEVMVSLIIGTLIAGAVMGLISVSLQFTYRVKERSRIQPYLEAAAQEILAHPEKAEPGSMTLGDSHNRVIVNVALVREEGIEGRAPGNNPGELYRVMLNCQGRVLEFSILIPRQQM